MSKLPENTQWMPGPIPPSYEPQRNNFGGIATGDNSISIGTNGPEIPVASGNRAISIGSGGVASGTNSVCIGRASCLHSNSVALGSYSTTTINQIKIGGRHLEFDNAGTIQAPGPANGRLYVRLIGGKPALCCKLGNNNEIILAQQA